VPAAATVTEDSNGGPGLGTPQLDDGDLEVLRLLAEGFVLEAVAKRTHTSERTVRRRARAICDRLGVQTPIQAVVWAARRGLL
jgi:DNA-binding NarL/FixJ family response regulator